MGRKKHLLEVKLNLFLILAFKHVRMHWFSKQKAHIPFILRLSVLQLLFSSAAIPEWIFHAAFLAAWKPVSSNNFSS